MGFQVITPKERETDKSTQCHVLYETGTMIGLESAVLGMVCWVERLDKRWEDAMTARRNLCYGPQGLIVTASRFGIGPVSITSFVQSSGEPTQHQTIPPRPIPTYLYMPNCNGLADDVII